MSARSMPSGKRRLHGHASTRGRLGFTLIELMVALLLGLIVIGGVISVFLAGQRTYRTNEALSDVGNGSRTAFELLARDIRNVGDSGCDNSSGRIANVLTTGTLWYTNWSNALYGYDDGSTDPALTGITGAGAPVANNASLHVLSAAATDVAVSYTPGQGTADLLINAPTTQLATGDIIMVCDFDHATIVQITGYANNSTTIAHNTGSGTPGNCTSQLGYPVLCTANGNHYDFQNNAQIAVLTAHVWYVGANPVGGTSLYRLSVGHGSNGLPGAPQEMVRNVASMKILYLQPPGAGFGLASSVTSWTAVNAVQITLTVQSTYQRAGAHNLPLSRTFTSTTTARNRVL